MTVHFIGAGPGAADLITLRGARLISRCPVCLYAGSLVNPELLALCPEGALIEVNQQKLPGCYLHRSNPNDVARTEHCTFICTPSQRLAGPTNNWMADDEAYARLRGLFAGWRIAVTASPTTP